MVHDGPPDEYGILYATRVALIEIKNRPTTEDVKELLEGQIPHFIRFMSMFSRLSNAERYSVIGAIGGMIMNGHVRSHAERSGIYVLTQRSEDGASIANADDFIPRDFITGSDAPLDYRDLT